MVLAMVFVVWIITPPIIIWLLVVYIVANFSIWVLVTIIVPYWVFYLVNWPVTLVSIRKLLRLVRLSIDAPLNQ